MREMRILSIWTVQFEGNLRSKPVPAQAKGEVLPTPIKTTIFDDITTDFTVRPDEALRSLNRATAKD